MKYSKRNASGANEHLVHVTVWSQNWKKRRVVRKVVPWRGAQYKGEQSRTCCLVNFACTRVVGCGKPCNAWSLATRGRIARIKMSELGALSRVIGAFGRKHHHRRRSLGVIRHDKVARLASRDERIYLDSGSWVSLTIVTGWVLWRGSTRCKKAYRRASRAG